MFLKNSFDSTIHEIVLNKEDEAFIASVNRDLKCYIESLENIKYVSYIYVNRCSTVLCFLAITSSFALRYNII